MNADGFHNIWFQNKVSACFYEISKAACDLENVNRPSIYTGEKRPMRANIYEGLSEQFLEVLGVFSEKQAETSHLFFP
jgi:hypothetical protein